MRQNVGLRDGFDKTKADHCRCYAGESVVSGDSGP